MKTGGKDRLKNGRKYGMVSDEDRIDNRLQIENNADADEWRRLISAPFQIFVWRKCTMRGRRSKRRTDISILRVFSQFHRNGSDSTLGLGLLDAKDREE